MFIQSLKWTFSWIEFMTTSHLFLFSFVGWVVAFVCTSSVLIGLLAFLPTFILLVLITLVHRRAFRRLLQQHGLRLITFKEFNGSSQRRKLPWWIFMKDYSASAINQHGDTEFLLCHAIGPYFAIASPHLTIESWSRSL